MKLMISDPTLRDGSHAVKHQFTREQIRAYATAADAAGIPVIEVGHGNGLGASSLQAGQSLLTDEEMLTTARECIKKAKLGIHVMPGIATINKDLAHAIDIGVDIVRVASHCTEADITARHISYARQKGKEVFGVLMMSHMETKEVLIEECYKLVSYGAEGVILMDSAGAYLPVDVREKVSFLSDNLSVPVGFHAHNNLGMAIANSLAAVEAGAKIIDGTIAGFGAGAGNAQLEILVAILNKNGYETGIDLYKILDLAQTAIDTLLPFMPSVKPTSIVSGLAGVFSGFTVHVERIARQYNVDPKDIFFELGRRKVVAGQEDLIVEVAEQLQKKDKR